MLLQFYDAPDNLDTIFDFSLGNIGSHQDLPLNYIYSAKIACSTVKATLLKDDSEPHGPFEIKFCKGKIFFNKPFFCITRNPYKRALSGYFDKISTGENTVVWPAFYKKYNLNKSNPPTFTEFLEILNKDKKQHLIDPHFRPQYLLANSKYIKPFFVGRIERFDDVVSFLEKYNFNVIRWSPHSQKSKYSKFEFSEKQVELIKNIYKRDFQIYDYDLDPLSEYIPSTIYQKQKINPIFKLVATKRSLINKVFQKVKTYKNKLKMI